MGVFEQGFEPAELAAEAEQRIVIENRNVLIARGTQSVSMMGLLLVAGFIVWAWKYVVLVGAAVLVIGLLYLGLRQELKIRERERDAKAALVARADAQHNWVMQGDPRGTYGEDYQELDPPEPVTFRAPCPRPPGERRRLG